MGAGVGVAVEAGIGVTVGVRVPFGKQICSKLSMGGCTPELLMAPRPKPQPSTMPLRICQADAPKQICGGFAGLSCPAGLTCVDDPSDSCDPAKGGADCSGICVK